MKGSIPNPGVTLGKIPAGGEKNQCFPLWNSLVKYEDETQWV